MHKLIFILFLFFAPMVMSQENLDEQYVDSVTYQYYINGAWNDVIGLGKKALKQGLNFKYLQQRMGYAYFQKSDYHEAIRYYEKALDFDPLDEVSLLYLHYSGLNIADHDFARHYAGKLSKDRQEQIGEKSFRPVNAVDFEYCYKWHSEATRSNPNYQRIGLNTQLGYSANLYQAISSYNQSATYTDEFNDYRSAIKQNEYYMLLSGYINANIGIDLGYHYANAKYHTEVWDLTLNEMTEQIDTLKFPTHLLYGGIHYKWYRFNLKLSESFLHTASNNTFQTGIHLGFALPGNHNIYIRNSVYFLKDNDDQWKVSQHSIGLLLLKKFWLEGEQSFGKLTNFADKNGMYIYNSFDSSLSKSSLSLFWYANKHFILFSNFSLEKKQQDILLNYYQQKSISGGIIWKL